MQVCRIHHTFHAEITLTFCAFLSKDVAFEGLLKRDLSGARYSETLFCTRIGFNLWHVFETLIIRPDGRHRTDNALWEPFGKYPVSCNQLIGAQK